MRNPDEKGPSLISSWTGGRRTKAKDFFYFLTLRRVETERVSHPSSQTPGGGVVTRRATGAAVVSDLSSREASWSLVGACWSLTSASLIVPWSSHGETTQLAVLASFSVGSVFTLSLNLQRHQKPQLHLHSCSAAFLAFYLTAIQTVCVRGHGKKTAETIEHGSVTRCLNLQTRI